MKKYLILYQSDAALGGVSVSEMMANSTPEQMQAGMALWRAWYEKCAGAIVDLGSPLDKSTSITGAGGGPGKTSITGYTILKAGSVDEAVALMKDHPHFHAPGASIQVLECVPMPGM